MAEPIQNPFWPKMMPFHLVLPNTSLYYNLVVSAERYPDKPATVFYDAVLDYQTLRREADALAGWLQTECGITRGDRVLLYLQNSPQFFVGYYAILRANGFVVPVNPMLKTEELRHFVMDSGAKAVLCAEDIFPQIEPLLARNGGPAAFRTACVGAYADYLTAKTDLAVPEFISAPSRLAPAKDIWRWKDALAAGRTPGPLEVGAEDFCVMPYTSGTTGQPKGCVHLHRNVMHTAIGMSVLGQAGPDAVVLGAVPLFHVTGMQACMNMVVFVGATVVLLPRWDRRVAAAMIERYRVTGWANVPTMVVDLLALPELDEFDLSSLRRVSGGGAAMPAAVAQKMRDLWSMDYVEGYGLSETMAPSHSNPPDRAKKQCLGIPFFDTESHIINPETGQILSQGETGEIVIFGPQVFQGYWNDPDKTAQAFIEIDGKRFLRTGDLGRIDEEGYYFMVDRLKRMINASGFKVWPAEVESLLYHHPGIQEACIIASLDAYRGETVKAVVVLRPAQRGSVTESDIIDWAREHMAAYKVPRLVEFVDSLPKSGTGKVAWRKLQEEEQARTQAPKAA